MTQRTAPAPETGAGDRQRPAEPSPPRRFLRWADLALVALAFGAAIRTWQWAVGRPLWLDEELIAMNLRGRGFAALAGPLENLQSAPLGWLWAQRTMVELFGTSERVLRFVPLLFGLATLVVAWLVGRRWLGPVGAFSLVGLCAVNDALVRYSGQVKHYSADSFFVLLLVGLAGWVVEDPRSLRRVTLWWLAAAAGAWMSMGAILTTPGLAAVILGTVWWRGRWADAARAVLPGLVWLAAFAAHYLLALRYTTTGNAYMTRFWAGLGYPPRGSGPTRLVHWLLDRPQVLAANPLHLDAGIANPGLATAAAALFWLLALAGVLVAAVRRLPWGLLVLAPVASGFALGVLRMVPLVNRLALWFVPALFLAVAVALEAAARAARRLPALWRERRTLRLVPAGAAAASLLTLAFLVPYGASAAIAATEVPTTDDRAAVRWMQAHHRPGDLTLVVGSASRALQWYDPDQRLQPAAMVTSKPAGPDCDPDALRRATQGFQRVLAYGGIRIVPYHHTHEVLRDRLAELGSVVEVHSFGAGESVVYLVDLTAPSAPVAAGGTCIMVG
jgi:hypothetical protein